LLCSHCSTHPQRYPSGHPRSTLGFWASNGRPGRTLNGRFTPGGAGYSTESEGPIRQLSRAVSGSLTSTRAPNLSEGGRRQTRRRCRRRVAAARSVDQLPGNVAHARDTPAAADIAPAEPKGFMKCAAGSCST
jgi:hypothetical protein